MVPAEARSDAANLRQLRTALSIIDVRRASLGLSRRTRAAIDAFLARLASACRTHTVGQLPDDLVGQLDTAIALTLQELSSEARDQALVALPGFAPGFSPTAAAYQPRDIEHRTTCRMRYELDLFGVIVPSLLLWSVLAYFLARIASKVMGRIGLYRHVWHRGTVRFRALRLDHHRPGFRFRGVPVMKALLNSLRHFALTGLMVGIALLASYKLWDYYFEAPWTRDGHVRADVVPVAPDVSGFVTEVLVRDNQQVQRGMCCFGSTGRGMHRAGRQAEASSTGKRASLDEANSDLKRYSALTPDVVVSKQRMDQVVAAQGTAKGRL